jgi:acyl-CoA thioesterase FadM
LTTLQRIRWSDMDMLGHVNNTVYFRYMEQARIEWMYSLVGGAARMVWTDRTSGRPVPLPKAVVAPLRAAVD